MICATRAVFSTMARDAAGRRLPPVRNAGVDEEDVGICDGAERSWLVQEHTECQRREMDVFLLY